MACLTLVGLLPATMSCIESGRPSMYFSIALSKGVTMVGHNRLSSSYRSV
ncbi:hypothetical protein HanIR_Chr17g0881081 [Helianthus annuus]|nr:hypothetical protein HanIR_Chr17g0881081 [Helianthus annuus]